MDFDQTMQLIQDTLYFRRVLGEGSCLVANSAALELRSHDASVLRGIENVLHDVVAREPSGKLSKQFLGLSDLFVAYLLIGAKYDPSRIDAFLRTLPVHLQAEAVAVLPIVFEAVGNGFRYGIGPPDALLAFAQEASHSSSEPLKKKANRALSFLVKHCPVIESVKV